MNNKKFKKYRIPLLLIPISLGGIFLFQYLTFIPEYSSATEISTEDPIAPVKEWDKLKYMQQMTLEACNSVDTPAAKNGNTINTNVPTKQLIDSRDGKTYWVAKLADGNCWMMQNLNLDLEAYRKYTNIDTDISGDSPFIPAESETDDTEKLYTSTLVATATDGKYTLSSVTWPNSLTIIRSYDPGENMIVSGYGLVKDDNADSHLFVGNYYSWAAATAGTGSTVEQGMPASDSICPKGWRLPTNSGSLSFNGLTSAYGIRGSTGSAIIREAPFYFLYGGIVDNANGSFNGSGGSGYYWSATRANNVHDAYFLYLDSVNTITSSYARSAGFSIRCIAKDISDSTSPTPGSGIESPDVSVTVPNIITLSLSSEVVDIDTSTSNPAEGNFTATVTSNSKYNLALSATASEGQTPHTDLKNEDPNKTTSIPALSSTNPIVTEADESWWGIKCTNPTDSTNSTNCTKTAYTGLTLNPDTYFTSTSGTPSTGTETPFTIGIKISPSLPSGTYSTSIQVTASSTGSN